VDVTGMATPSGAGAACPACAEPVESAHRFCEACGSDLRVRHGGTEQAVSGAAGPEQPPCRGCGAAAPDPPEEYCPECGLRRRDGSDRVETDLGDLAGVSDRGRVHPRNEDAMALGRREVAGGRVLRATVVCDGVSSVHDPELASRLAARTALDVLLAEPAAPGADAPPTDRETAADGGRRVRAAVAEAARRVAGLGEPGDEAAPSCTLVCALVSTPATGGGAVMSVGWVGDSRAYWLALPDRAGAPPEEPSRLLTTDHSWAVEMVLAGRLTAEAARADRRAHVITRWLGRDGDAEPGLLAWRHEGPGVLLLCTDGLWNYLPDPADLTSVLTEGRLGGAPACAAAAFTELALAAGGRDNITVCLIPVGTPDEGEVA
jgi:PPM family protein phosphatase